jgi:thiol-disulfide isomerase/thioredoxin
MRFSPRSLALSILAALVAGTSGALAGVLLEPTDAPEWKVSEWLNSDGSRLKAHRGKLVLIDFFQMWCPGSTEFSLPLFEEWAETYGTRDDVVVVSIHTVFEEHEAQTPELLRQFLEEYGITHPVGIDAYKEPGDKVPITMDRFETGGTPHVVIVDKAGRLRFSHFGVFDRKPVERFIERILEEEEDPFDMTSTKATQDKKKRRRRDPASRRAGGRPTPRAAEPEPPPPPEPAVEADPSGDPAEQSGSDPHDEQEGAPDDGEEPEEAEEPDASLSGSYKLRFEMLAKSCGDPTRPIEVITQIRVTGDRLEAQFSRPFLGVRHVTANYDPGSGSFDVDAEQEAQETGGVNVQLSLQVSGRFVSIENPPELEFDYYLDEVSEDGTTDCTYEGRGGGPRFRGR